ncbi:MAG: hypothetical protein CFK48_06025 [Armatimonadetes bacterium CP1_7O]|nr:MAG: hypothetical protein CFK48_06025 [Armatimonadetes bacterium CP1_7O]
MMGMSLKIIEGTWDEVQQHAQELQGRRVRVLVLPEPSVSAQGTLREFLGEFVGCIEGRAEPMAECAEEAVETLIAETYREQGLKI